MATLYDITADQQTIVALLEETGGELTPEIEEAMAITREELETKAENYGKVIFEYKAKEEALANEIARLTAKKKTAQNIQQRMKERIAEALRVFDVDKLEAGAFRYGFRNSERVEISDLNHLPDKFIIVEKKADKKALFAAIKAGEQIIGATIEKNQTLQIR